MQKKMTRIEKNPLGIGLYYASWTVITWEVRTVGNQSSCRGHIDFLFLGDQRGLEQMLTFPFLIFMFLFTESTLMSVPYM